jgi:hypothetical protein
VGPITKADYDLKTIELWGNAAGQEKEAWINKAKTTFDEISKILKTRDVRAKRFEEEHLRRTR